MLTALKGSQFYFYSLSNIRNPFSVLIHFVTNVYIVSSIGIILVFVPTILLNVCITLFLVILRNTTS